MLIQLYTIRDSKNAFGKIFMYANEAAAARAFEEGLLSDPTMQRFPEDFTLQFLGVYNDDDGQITARQPERVISGLEVLQARQLKETAARVEDPNDQGDGLTDSQRAFRDAQEELNYGGTD